MTDTSGRDVVTKHLVVLEIPLTQDEFNLIYAEAQGRIRTTDAKLAEATWQFQPHLNVWMLDEVTIAGRGIPLDSDTLVWQMPTLGGILRETRPAGTPAIIRR